MRACVRACPKSAAAPVFETEAARCDPLPTNTLHGPISGPVLLQGLRGRDQGARLLSSVQLKRPGRCQWVVTMLQVALAATIRGYDKESVAQARNHQDAHRLSSHGCRGTSGSHGLPGRVRHLHCIDWSESTTSDARPRQTKPSPPPRDSSLEFVHTWRGGRHGQP